MAPWLESELFLSQKSVWWTAAFHWCILMYTFYTFATLKWKTDIIWFDLLLSYWLITQQKRLGLGQIYFLHLLCCCTVEVQLLAAFKNDKCALILEHHSNHCFYSSREEKWSKKNSLGLNKHLSLQPSTLFMRFFIFSSTLHALTASSLLHSLKLPLQRLYVYLQRAGYEWWS